MLPRKGEIPRLRPRLRRRLRDRIGVREAVLHLERRQIGEEVVALPRRRRERVQRNEQLFRLLLREVEEEHGDLLIGSRLGALRLA